MLKLTLLCAAAALLAGCQSTQNSGPAADPAKVEACLARQHDFDMSTREQAVYADLCRFENKLSPARVAKNARCVIKADEEKLQGDERTASIANCKKS